MILTAFLEGGIGVSEKRDRAVDSARKHSAENRQSGTAEQEQKLRRFQQGIDLVQPVSSVGDALVQTAVQKVEGSDEQYSAGVQETKKYVMPTLDAAAILSAKEHAKGIRAELNQITVTCGQVHDLVREGKLSVADLADKKNLEERLEAVEGLSAFQKHQIGKFRDTVYDLLLVRDELERKQGVVDKLEAPLRSHLRSKDFFDLQKEQTNELLKIYFQMSRNDVLKKVNPAHMSEQKLRKLLDTGDRNGFTAADAAAIRLAERQVKYRESRIRIGKLLNIQKRVERMRFQAEGVEGTAGEGIRQISTTAQVAHGAYAVGKFGLKAGIVSASFAGKYTGASFLLCKMNRFRRAKTEQLKKSTKEAVKSSRTYQAVSGKKVAAKSRVSDVKKKATATLDQSSTVQTYKQVQAKAREHAKRVAKKAGQTKAAAHAAGRHVRQGMDITLSPLRFVGRASSRVRSIVEKAGLWLMASAGIVVAVFLVIVVLVNAMLSICQTVSGVAMSAILTEDDHFIAGMNAALQMKATAKKSEAEKIAQGTPKDPDVLGGHTISKYGHPDGNGNYVDGSKIVYVDGNGNVILSGMNNIKDCIAMAYVIMDGDFDTDAVERDDLIMDLWELMNPAVTYQESDIYTCGGGCGTASLLPGEEGEMETVCYGHKDVEVYVTVRMMEDMFAHGDLPVSAGKSYQTYLSAFSGWTEENKEWARCLVNADWYDMYGVDPSGGTGSVSGSGMTLEEIAAMIGSYGDLDAVRKALCSDAMSFVGRIPYYWGGKASAKDYAANGFYAPVTPDEKGRDKKGLDCSGFVQWIIWRVTGVKRGASTATITDGLEQITAAELQPGDLGLMAVPGSASNHVGIFVGYDESGQALWCHENSSSGNVAVNNTTCFRLYYRIF